MPRLGGVDQVAADDLLTEAELAEYCRVFLRTVRRWRAEGTGPPVLWAGNRPRYKREDVDAWLRRRAEEGEHRQ